MENKVNSYLKGLFIPDSASHKGENGKVLVIGGSVLFHAASLWPLNVASRIVDMVFYSSVDDNNEIVKKHKEEFRNGIVVPRSKIEDYIEEADAILIGPGLPRNEGVEKGDDDTLALTSKYLINYRHKKWVVDGGSLQVISPEILPSTSIITPHKKEFEKLFSLAANPDNALKMAKKYNLTIILKGEKDYVVSPEDTVEIKGGNAGMTKGGTGDVLAGLVVALYSKNPKFPSAVAASYINKKAGEALYERVGYYFNASDLADEIPRVMKNLL